MALTQQQEADYQRLKGLEVALLKDPETERELNALVVKAGGKSPKHETELLIEKRVKERVEPLELKEAVERQTAREAEEINSRQRTRLKRAPFNLTDEDIDECVKLVNEKYKEGEIISLETAARYLASMRPSVSAGPVKTPFSTRLARPKNDFRKMLKDPKSKLFTDTRQYVNEEFDRAWDEGL